jgi:hypothetical protein
LLSTIATARRSPSARPRYDAARRPATAAVVLASRAAGPTACLDIVEQRAPDGFANLDDVVSQAELEQIAADFTRTAGLERDVLNRRPSLSVRPLRSAG